MPDAIKEEDCLFEARIEQLERHTSFLVITGWLITPYPIVAGERVAISIGRYSAPILGFFPRPDIASAEQQLVYGFRTDLSFKGTIPLESSISLSVDGMGEMLFPISTLSIVEFTPVAAFDPSSLNYIAGWLFAPELWHDSIRIHKPIIKVFSTSIPVELNYFRYDLPFSAARAGRMMGFQFSLEDYAEQIFTAERDSSKGFIDLKLTLGSRIIAETQIAAPDDEVESLLGLKNGKLEVTPSLIQLIQPSPNEDGIEDQGFVDFWGFNAALGGWIVGGWVRNGTVSKFDEISMSIQFEDSVLHENGSLITYNRADVAEFGIGFVMFIPGHRHSSPLRSIIVENRSRLKASDAARCVDDNVVLKEARSCLLVSRDGGVFRDIIQKPVFDGSDTIASLGPDVLMGIDDVVVAPGQGFVLVGWLLDPMSLVRTLTVRSDVSKSGDLFGYYIPTERPDIAQAFGPTMGLTHSRWGFTAFAKLSGADTANAYLEVVLKDGRIGHKALPVPKRSGLPAINRVLNDVVLSPDTFRHALEKVLSVPAKAINRARKPSQARDFEAVAGTPVKLPRASIVIPLYGRLDFMMYQMALVDPLEHRTDEFIYVLDQPERKEEFLELARSCYIKFGIPLRLIVPDQNLGFAGASNAGLRSARGEFVTFLNSDVIPKSRDWLSRLIRALTARKKNGIASALLLFEDETVQHMGMDFQRMQQFGNLLFPFHPAKGRRPPSLQGVEVVPAVTGACMVMRRPLAVEIGGFDEDYIIGDFEDADLCMKIRARGLDCIVDRGTVLYHLERQSQSKAVNRHRMNLTLLNAWTFAERWDPQIASTAAESSVLKLA